MAQGRKENEFLQVSMVFPAYNEADKLEEAVEKALHAAKELACSYEIIIAEDGSVDGTDKLAHKLAERYPTVKHLHGDERLGRGAALKNAFMQSKGEILVYMDTDLATNLEHLKSLCAAIELEGYDFATGSRMLPQSKVERSLSRGISSKSYNLLVRVMLGSKIKDHQCGFKAFKKESVLPLLDEVKARHWFWDTEILVRAARKGYKIKEISVEWKSGRKTKVNLLKDSLGMGRQVIQLWWNLRSE